MGGASRLRSGDGLAARAARPEAARLQVHDRPHPRDLRGIDGGLAPGRARPDDRRHRAAADRLRPRRNLPVLLGLHGLHAGQHRDRPALREARGRLRAEAAVHLRDRRLPPRLRALRARAEHDAARDLPRHPGSGRRWSVPARARGGRLDRPAPRTRPLPGADRCGVRVRVDHRARAGRLHRRQHDVALDLLRQPARRRARATRHLDHDAEAGAADRALDRLGGSGAARGLLDLAAARARLGEQRLHVDVGAGRGIADRLRALLRGVSALRAARFRADSPVRPDAQPDRRSEPAVHSARRDGDVRDDLVRSAVRSGRDRDLRDVVGSRAHAADPRGRDGIGPVANGCRGADACGRTRSPARSS
jgi:hypothetical protein